MNIRLGLFFFVGSLIGTAISYAVTRRKDVIVPSLVFGVLGSFFVALIT